MTECIRRGVTPKFCIGFTHIPRVALEESGGLNPPPPYHPRPWSSARHSGTNPLMSAYRVGHRYSTCSFWIDFHSRLYAKITSATMYRVDQRTAQNSVCHNYQCNRSTQNETDFAQMFAEFMSIDSVAVFFSSTCYILHAIFMLRAWRL